MTRRLSERVCIVTGAALFLASDECRYINGENLMVDGGWMAG